MKILIVEDNADITEALLDELDQHECETASNGTKASELISLKSYDLVITDINFPGGGGERILNELSTKSIPVIVFTCQPDYEFKKYYTLGATKVISKSYLGRLLNSIREIEKISKESQKAS